METIDVKITLPKVDGYEYTREYRPPKKGEWYLASLTNLFVQASYDYYTEFLILRKVWQEPRTADGQPLLPHGWLARDSDDDNCLFWYDKKPERNLDARCFDYCDDSGVPTKEVSWLLPDCPLTWDDEPLEVGKRDG